jgi:hypothetical protein
MTLRDKAYELAKTAYDAAGHAEAKDKLQKEFPRVDWDELVSAYLEASRLSDAAYAFGDRIRRGLLTESRALEEAKKEYPAFSEATYRDFLTHGLLTSR